MKKIIKKILRFFKGIFRVFDKLIITPREKELDRTKIRDQLFFQLSKSNKYIDIQYLINEFYSTDEDRNDLSESAKKSRKLFNQYCKDIQKDLDKLSQLEAIEEELKSFEKYKELIALYKKLDNADYIWKKYKNRDGTVASIVGRNIKWVDGYVYVNLKEKQFLINKGYGDENYFFEDYGKTWAFTKEELEGK